MSALRSSLLERAVPSIASEKEVRESGAQSPSVWSKAFASVKVFIMLVTELVSQSSC